MNYITSQQQTLCLDQVARPENSHHMYCAFTKEATMHPTLTCQCHGATDAQTECITMQPIPSAHFTMKPNDVTSGQPRGLVMPAFFKLAGSGEAKVHSFFHIEMC